MNERCSVFLVPENHFLEVTSMHTVAYCSPTNGSFLALIPSFLCFSDPTGRPFTSFC